jgi:prefoldin subunit 5
MNITRETKLAELLREYPWLREEIVKVNEKFSMLNSPLGKIMEKKATIAEMSKKSGMDEDALIVRITELIRAHS